MDAQPIQRKSLRWRYAPIAVDGTRIDTWIIDPLSSHSYLYVAWPRTLLVRLSDEALDEILTHLDDGRPNPTVRDLSAIVPKAEPGPERETIHDSAVLTLGITDGCNLGCRYCYVGLRSDTAEQWTPLDAIEAAARRVAQSARAKSFAGVVHIQGAGEPTFRPSHFLNVVRLIQSVFSDIGADLTLSTTTNGTFPDEVLDVLKTQFAAISVSLDGPETVQDLHRPYRDGSSSFDLIMRNTRALYDASQTGGPSLGLRCTVSDVSVKILPEIHRFFSNSFPGTPVKYEPLAPLGAALADESLRSPPVAEFVAALVDLHDCYGYDLGAYSASGAIGAPKLHFCKSLSVPTLNLDEEARLVACQGYGIGDLDEYVIGHFDRQRQDFVFDEERISQFRGLSVFDYPACESCLAKYHCAGDCPELRRQRLLRCSINRSAVEELVLDNIRELEAAHA